jgi:hypothetical protein
MDNLAAPATPIGPTAQVQTAGFGQLMAVPLRALVWLLVRVYQYTLGVMLPNACRFTPTCSEYLLQATRTHGLRGVGMGLWRILRCNPWGGFGPDPVPPKTSPPNQ